MGGRLREWRREREGRGGGTWCAQEEDDAHQLLAGGEGREAHPHRTAPHHGRGLLRIGPFGPRAANLDGWDAMVHLSQAQGDC